ncbi:MAG: very short patch repair endonuclease [Bacteroidetes bacterium]|nr:very short patch repair endonuclease [Bacteroidota bacterium]
MRKQTTEQVRRKMQAVKSSGSKIETALAKALWGKGYRYRKNNKTVFGTPDITFKQLKIAIFVDSEFWHGKNWEVRKYDHKTNKKFWYTKIENNIARDKLVNRTLKKSGWQVLRFWGNDIENKLEFCVKKIEQLIKNNVG